MPFSLAWDDGSVIDAQTGLAGMRMSRVETGSEQELP